MRLKISYVHLACARALYYVISWIEHVARRVCIETNQRTVSYTIIQMLVVCVCVCVSELILVLEKENWKKNTETEKKEKNSVVEVMWNRLFMLRADMKFNTKKHS